MNQNLYNGDQIPADKNLSLIHASAHRVGIVGKQICLCCGYPVCENLLKLSVDKEDLTFLGSGYPLYFAFIKNCVSLLCIHLMASGQFNLISNFQGEDCIPKSQLKNYSETKMGNVCIRDIVTAFSLANRRNRKELALISDILTLTSTLLMFGFLIYFRRNQKKLDVFCDLQELTPSDYTVMAYNIDDPSKLKDFFEKDLFRLSKKIQVKKINLAYDLSYLSDLQKQKQDILIKKKRAFKDKTIFDDGELVQINQAIENAKEQCDFVGLAFISLKYERMKSEVINAALIQYFVIFINALTGLNFNEGRRLDYYGRPIYVEVAPEPTDVNWNSISVWAANSISRRIIGQLISVVVNIMLSIGVFCSILKQVEVLGQITQEHEEEGMLSAHYIKVHFYSLAYSLITVVINSVLLPELTIAIVSFQAYPTFSQVNLAIAKKLSFMMFLNSAFMQCLISFFSGNIYYPGGLAYNMTYFFIMNAFVPPLIQMLDAQTIIRKIKIYFYLNFDVLTQKEQNELFELPEHKIEEGYAEVLKTMNVTFFLGPLLPLGYIFSIIGLILFYWAEKYQLLRKKSVKHTPSFELSSQMTDSLQLIPIIHLFSCLVYKYLILSYSSLICFITLIIALIYHFIPNNHLVNLLWDFDEHDEYEKYRDSTYIFNYDRENPITQQKAIKKWLIRKSRLEKRKEKIMLASKDYAGLKQQEKEILQEIDCYQ